MFFNTLQLSTDKSPKIAQGTPKTREQPVQFFVNVNHLKCETCSKGLIEVC